MVKSTSQTSLAHCQIGSIKNMVTPQLCGWQWVWLPTMTTIRPNLKQEPSKHRQQSHSQVRSLFRFHSIIRSQQLFWRLPQVHVSFMKWDLQRERKGTRWGLNEHAAFLEASLALLVCCLSYTLFTPLFSPSIWNTRIMSIQVQAGIFRHRFWIPVALCKTRLPCALLALRSC